MIVNKNNFSIRVFDNITLSNEQKFESTDEERIKHLITIFKEEFIIGNILEFGVYKGTTINLITKHFLNEIVWGVDSFEGLPEDWITQHNSPVNGEFRALKEWLNVFNRSFIPLYRSNYMQCSIKIIK
jgi:hypothetical protein